MFWLYEVKILPTLYWFCCHDWTSTALFAAHKRKFSNTMFWFLGWNKTCAIRWVPLPASLSRITNFLAISAYSILAEVLQMFILRTCSGKLLIWRKGSTSAKSKSPEFTESALIFRFFGMEPISRTWNSLVRIFFLPFNKDLSLSAVLIFLPALFLYGVRFMVVVLSWISFFLNERYFRRSGTSFSIWRSVGQCDFILNLKTYWDYSKLIRSLTYRLFTSTCSKTAFKLK